MNGSPLIWAVSNNRKDVVEDMVKKEEFKIDAISRGNDEMAQFLVHNLNANVNVTKLGWGSLLTGSIFKADFKAVDLLLTDLKADPNISVDVDGCGDCSYTPLHYAMWNDFQK